VARLLGTTLGRAAGVMAIAALAVGIIPKNTFAQGTAAGAGSSAGTGAGGSVGGPDPSGSAGYGPSAPSNIQPCPVPPPPGAWGTPPPTVAGPGPVPINPGPGFWPPPQTWFGPVPNLSK
jgi:hypothetical protein